MSAALPKHLLDWGSLAPLRLHARHLADGAYSGVHRSRRRGSGVEFDSHRDYTPGDDLRRLDVRALIRHGRLLIRQFETDTERRLCLVLDGTISMAFKSERAPAAKLAYSALLAAALGRIAIANGDAVSLDWVGGASAGTLPASGGREAFERLVTALETVRPGGDETLNGAAFETALSPVARRARRGTVIVLFSDLVDLPEHAAAQFAALGNRQRLAIVVRVLDPVEAQFPFEGALHLRSSWGNTRVETDGVSARAGYLAALDAQRRSWEERLLAHGGQLHTCTTDENPAEVLRRILRRVEGHS